jgi:hypothetical protein
MSVLPVQGEDSRRGGAAAMMTPQVEEALGHLVCELQTDVCARICR